MIITKTPLNNLLIIQPEIFSDNRGCFFESYNKKNFDTSIQENINFVQDNHSVSSLGVVRGLHYQIEPFEQSKLVRVIKGEIFDVAVDLRKNSKTLGKWFGVILNEKNYKQLWIPRGFAHGFVALKENTHVLYKTDNFYMPKYEKCIKFNDKTINIKWPKCEVSLSDKDINGDSFEELFS